MPITGRRGVELCRFYGIVIKMHRDEHPPPHFHAERVAFARGPLVYRLERPDVDFPVVQARVDLAPDDVSKRIQVKWHRELLDGIHVLHVPGVVDDKPVDLPLVPWYVRANRSDGSRWVVMIPNAGTNP